MGFSFDRIYLSHNEIRSLQTVLSPWLITLYCVDSKGMDYYLRHEGMIAANNIKTYPYSNGFSTQHVKDRGLRSNGAESYAITSVYPFILGSQSLIHPYQIFR